MGFFSWRASNDQMSIPNCYQEVMLQFNVIMIDDKGNKWEEPSYEGYGVFGGKDFYELLAEMNGQSGRNAGIKIEGKEKIKHPNLISNIHGDELEKWTYTEEGPENCEFQGHFY